MRWMLNALQRPALSVEAVAAAAARTASDQRAAALLVVTETGEVGGARARVGPQRDTRLVGRALRVQVPAQRSDCGCHAAPCRRQALRPPPGSAAAGSQRFHWSDRGVSGLRGCRTGGSLTACLSHVAPPLPADVESVLRLALAEMVATGVVRKSGDQVVAIHDADVGDEDEQANVMRVLTVE